MFDLFILRLNHMHIGLVSDHTLIHPSQSQALYPCVNALTTRHHFDIHWLFSTNTISTLAGDPAWYPADTSDMPPTCRHVIPYTLLSPENRSPHWPSAIFLA